MTPITPEALAGLLAKVAPDAETWTVIAKSKHGYQVINEAGDAELGNWLIAECWWKEVAEFIALAPQLAADWLHLTADLSAALAANAALVQREAEARALLRDLERAATVVGNLGAVTGPQWGKLTISVLRARAFLATAKETAP